MFLLRIVVEPSQNSDQFGFEGQLLSGRHRYEIRRAPASALFISLSHSYFSPYLCSYTHRSTTGPLESASTRHHRYLNNQWGCLLLIAIIYILIILRISYVDNAFAGTFPNSFYNSKSLQVLAMVINMRCYIKYFSKLTYILKIKGE